MIVITTYYNPFDNVLMLNAFNRFYTNIKKQGARLIIAELLFGCNDSDLQLDSEDTYFSIRATEKNILFQKERVLNIALEYLPKDCENVAWIDADILFRDDDWIKKTEEILENYPVLQLFEYAHFDTDQVPYFILHGFGARFDRDNVGAHPGFAWAIKADIIKYIKFWDKNIIGCGDNPIARGFKTHHPQKTTFVIPSLYSEYSQIWAAAAYHQTQGRVSFLPGVIEHLHHGHFKKRIYSEVCNSLNDMIFEEHIQLGDNQLWEWRKESKYSKYTKDYLFNRGLPE